MKKVLEYNDVAEVTDRILSLSDDLCEMAAFAGWSATENGIRDEVYKIQNACHEINNQRFDEEQDALSKRMQNIIDNPNDIRLALQLLGQTKKIMAIKEFRRIFGVGLTEAKDAIESQDMVKPLGANW
jgi:hypothetical protein